MDPMEIVMTFDIEEDGRWIAEVEALPGVMAYGATREGALGRVTALALQVIAEQLEAGELETTPDALIFRAA